MKYLYDSHIGGLFTSESELTVEERYCEQCFDCDMLIGTFNNVKEFWTLVKDNCSIDGSGGLSLQWLWPFMVQEFGLTVEVPYESYDDKCQGFCSLTDDEVLNNIKILVDVSC